LSKENNGTDKASTNPGSNDMLTTQDLTQISEILDLEFSGDGEKKDGAAADASGPAVTDGTQASQPVTKTDPPAEVIPETVGAAIPETVGAADASGGGTPPPEEPDVIGTAGSGGGSSKGLPSRNQKKKSAKKIWRNILIILLILVAAAGIGVYVLYNTNRMDISTMTYSPKEKTKIMTADNVCIAELYSENRDYVSIDQVPQDLKNALVATEDSRFYSHNGVDYVGVIRALVSNLLGGSGTSQGASTITQQLARLLYLPDISTEQTFMDSVNRKFREISIAYQLEEKYSKDQILEMYLNEYYFGSGAYGIEAASETYFGIPVSQCDLAQSAMLAGLPQAPSVYAPNNDFEAAKKRQKEVLSRMVAGGYITQDQADAAYAEELTIVPWSPTENDNQITAGYSDYVDQVLQEYAKAAAPTVMKERGLSEDEAISYTRENVASGGYVFYTTIYSSYQSDAISTAENRMSSYGYDQSNGDTCALVTVDLDGAVRAYYGGNEAYSSIDMASTPRQPGSNIKPLYYSLGIENGTYTTSSILSDEPININGYSPQNYGGSYSGNITFAQSLIQSKNVTSVQIFNTLGVDAAMDWIKSFGFTTIGDDDYNLASALGGLTNGVEPLEMAAAFNTFNNSGVYNQPYMIQKVTTTSGEQTADKSSLGLVSKQIMSASTASTMWNLMRQVVTSGTGSSASTSEATAGKTGTTDNEENLWFTGMTGNLTTSIWVGNLQYNVVGAGSYIPAGIYGTYMQTLLNQGLVSQFNPENTPVTQDVQADYTAPAAQ
jgi:penicillin-binding protein 1A